MMSVIMRKLKHALSSIHCMSVSLDTRMVDMYGIRYIYSESIVLLVSTSINVCQMGINSV